MIAQPATSKFIIAVVIYAFTWNWAGHCRNHSGITATIFFWTHTSQAAACSRKKPISNHKPVSVSSMLPVHFLIVNVNGRAINRSSYYESIAWKRCARVCTSINWNFFDCTLQLCSYTVHVCAIVSRTESTVVCIIATLLLKSIICGQVCWVRGYRL